MERFTQELEQTLDQGDCGRTNLQGVFEAEALLLLEFAF
jgi:hypothetical protein